MDKIFAELRRSVSKPDKRTVRHKSWISAERWRIVNKRVYTRQEHRRYQRQLMRLGRAIREFIKEDR